MFTLQADGLAYAQKKIESLNKKAEKLGLPLLSLVIDGVEVWPVVAGVPVRPQDYDGKPVTSYTEVTLCRLEGIPPVLVGYTFIGRVEHLSEGNILSAAPGHELPAAYRSAPPVCQHCGLTRKRSNSYVLREDVSGSFVQVGRNCLADFLRDAGAADRILSWAESYSSTIREIQEHTGHGRTLWDTSLLVSWSIAYTKRFGWVSAAAARDRLVSSSSSVILYFLSSPQSRKYNPELVELESTLETIQDTRDLVLSYVLDYLENVEEESLSNYEANLVVCFKQKYIDAQHVGLVCSAYQAYLRHTAVTAEKELTKSKVSALSYVGTVGERVEAEVKVESIHGPYPGQYGDSYLCVFVEKTSGNKLIWWTGENLAFEVGEEHKIRGTVKAHTPFNGSPQTVLQRVKPVEKK